MRILWKLIKGILMITGFFAWSGVVMTGVTALSNATEELRK